MKIEDHEVHLALRESNLAKGLKKLEAANAALLDRATEQAIMLWFLKKMRGRMSRTEAAAIMNARQRQLDGKSHYRQLELILAETAKEMASLAST